MPGIAINGLSRVGRAALKIMLDSPEATIGANNDVAPLDTLADLTFMTERSTRVEEFRRIFTEEAESDPNSGILGVTSDPIVSSDILRDLRASVVALEMMEAIDAELVKIMSWSDNEWGDAQMTYEALISARSEQTQGAP